MSQEFRLHLAPEASPALRIAHRNYVAAVNAVQHAGDRHSLEQSRRAADLARRHYGAILLREDKARRPHIYTK